MCHLHPPSASDFPHRGPKIPRRRFSSDLQRAKGPVRGVQALPRPQVPEVFRAAELRETGGAFGRRAELLEPGGWWVLVVLGGFGGFGGGAGVA